MLQFPDRNQLLAAGVGVGEVEVQQAQATASEELERGPVCQLGLPLHQSTVAQSDLDTAITPVLPKNPASLF